MDKSDKPTVEGRMNEVVGTPIFVFQRAGIKPGLHIQFSQAPVHVIAVQHGS